MCGFETFLIVENHCVLICVYAFELLFIHLVGFPVFSTFTAHNNSEWSKLFHYCSSQVVQWLSFCTPKRLQFRFNSQSGHIPRLEIWSPVSKCTGGNLSMFLTLMFLSHSAPLPILPSSSPFSFSSSLYKINKCILRWGFKNIVSLFP